MKVVYKIRNKEGLYSTGGMYPSFSDEGKTWSKRNHISSHLAQFKDKNLFYKDCYIVKMEIIEEELETVSVTDWSVTDKTKRTKELQNARYINYHKEYKERRKEQLLKELKELDK